PLRPSFCTKASSSSYLYFDSAGRSPATSGGGGSLGKFCTYHFDQEPSSSFQSPLAAPNWRSLLQARSSSTARQRLPGSRRDAATSTARNGAGSSAFGFAGDFFRAVMTSKSTCLFVDSRPRSRYL